MLQSIHRAIIKSLTLTDQLKMNQTVLVSNTKDETVSKHSINMYIKVCFYKMLRWSKVFRDTLYFF